MDCACYSYDTYLLFASFVGEFATVELTCSEGFDLTSEFFDLSDDNLLRLGGIFLINCFRMESVTVSLSNQVM